jgi:polysaccharide export outer membrane protein
VPECHCLLAAFGSSMCWQPPGGPSLAGGGRQPYMTPIYGFPRRGGATVAYSTLIDRPDQNIFAEPGDVLTVFHRPRTFSVFGASGKNAAIEFNSEKLSLTEALAKTGGLNDDRADATAVFLFRYERTTVVRTLGQPVASDAPAGWSPIACRLGLGEAKSLLSQIVGPVLTGLVTCSTSAC